MKKYLLALALLPALASAENYFTEGTQWNYHAVKYAALGFPLNVSSMTYSLEGKEMVEGFEAMKLYSTFNYDPSTKEFVTYMRTDGDKVMFLPPKAPTEWATLYDFSLQPGEQFLATSLYYVKKDDDGNEVPRTGYITCESLTTASDYGDFPAMEVTGGPDQGTDPDTETWLMGIGRTWFLDDFVYTLSSVVAGEETVCSRNVSDQNLFDGLAFWQSEIFGDNPAIRKEWMWGGGQINGFNHFNLVVEMSHSGNSGFVRHISVDDKKIYRIDDQADAIAGVAYDFSMQPGDVRAICNLAAEDCETTYMRCESRRPSELFDGRDEIFLAEFADEAMTQFLGRGSWIDGIGTIHGLCNNSRFDRSVANEQLFMVVDYGTILWERSLAGIETISSDAPEVPSVSVDGCNIVADVPVTLYTIDGRRVSETSTIVTAPAPGIYVAASRSGAAKVAVK